MKVDIKDISETRKQLVVAFEAAEVDQELARVTGEISRHARIPGFRPGKAPAAIIRARFEKQITQELRQAVVGKAYRDGIKESGLDVIQVIDLPESPIAAGTPAEIEITVDIRPKFDLPEYKGLPVKAMDTSVSEEEIDRVIDDLRRERAEFRAVEREARAGDYVKFGFEGRIGDQKIAELVPDRPIYGTMPHTWEEAGVEEGLLPGAGKHLVGMKKDDAREVEITFPEGFVVPVLAGKTGTYAITVQEVRERVLPELDEAFLKAQSVATAEELRDRVKESLASRKQAEDRAERRRQVSDALAERTEFPIPEVLIDSETDALLRQLVEGNIRRGVPQDELEKNKEELYASARKAAIGRTKVRMLLARVAEAEELKLSADDLNRAIVREAMRRKEKPEKVVKELEKDRDQLQFLQQNVLFDKALDFLVDQATVTPA